MTVSWQPTLPLTPPYLIPTLVHTSYEPYGCPEARLMTVGWQPTMTSTMMIAHCVNAVRIQPAMAQKLK